MFAFWATILIPAVAVAEPQCNDRDSVIAQLAEKYNEARVAVSVTRNGGLIEVLSAGGSQTWSINITSPMGVSGLVAVGDGMWVLAVRPKEPET